MTERQFQIAFERQLNNIIPGYNIMSKLNSDTIFYYINRAKDEYVKQLYRAFQLNQELSDKLRTLVKTDKYVSIDFTRTGNRWSTDYPEGYMYTLGEQASINIYSNKCPALVSNSTDVIEATVETVDRILNNSLSEYRLHHNQARPVRLYTDGKIVLITDGNYGINEYQLTYLRNAKDLGNKLTEEYTELPVDTHQEIVDAAVMMYIQQAASMQQSDKSDKN